MHFTISHSPHLSGLFQFVPILMIFFWIAAATVHIFLASAVYNDARKISEQPGRDLYFLGDGVWSLAVLLGGVFVATAYWLMHHSTLNIQIARAKDSPTSLDDSCKDSDGNASA